MRVLKMLGLGLLGLIAVLVVVGLFLPRQWHVERTVVIKEIFEGVRLFIDLSDHVIGLNILRGHYRGCSMERLMRMLTVFGRDVEIVLKPAGRARRAGRITLVPVAA